MKQDRSTPPPTARRRWAVFGSRRGRIVSAAVVLLAVSAGAWLANAALWRPLPLVGEAIDDGYARASGVVHVHTTFSDGGGTPQEVVAAARAAGLDFVAITDHNNFDALAEEGYQDGVLVLAGSEISTTKGHLLALGIENEPTFVFSRDARDGLLDVRDLGGFSFAAHPMSPRPDLAWSGWEVGGPWGIEIVNGDSEWRRADRLRLAATLARYRVNPIYAMLRILSPSRAALDQWDLLLAERDVVGIFGADAHANLPISDSSRLRFPSYETVFSLARNHLLLDAPLSGDPAADRAAVLAAMRDGRFYIGLDGLAPADGFSFVVESPSGHQWTMGQSVTYRPGLRVRAGGRLPEGATVRLLHNGEPIADATDTLAAELPGPGVYRVEVHVDGWQPPWVLSNAIAVFDDETLAARVASYPAPPTPVEPSVMIDHFDGATVFSGAHDDRSQLDDALFDPDAGDNGAARVSFRLGEPTAEHPDVFIALINEQDRDLAGHRGLTFRVRGDGVYRMWVEVRDANPNSAEDGTEWWTTSVKTGTEWRQVSIPFSRLRSTNPQTDGQLDLDQVRALVFVVDKGAMPPGARATIWLDELGLY